MPQLVMIEAERFEIPRRVRSAQVKRLAVMHFEPSGPPALLAAPTRAVKRRPAGVLPVRAMVMFRQRLSAPVTAV